MVLCSVCGYFLETFQSGSFANVAGRGADHRGACVRPSRKALPSPNPSATVVCYTTCLLTSTIARISIKTLSL